MQTRTQTNWKEDVSFFYRIAVLALLACNATLARKQLDLMNKPDPYQEEAPSWTEDPRGKTVRTIGPDPEIDRIEDPEFKVR